MTHFVNEAAKSAVNVHRCLIFFSLTLLRFFFKWGIQVPKQSLSEFCDLSFYWEKICPWSCAP